MVKKQLYKRLDNIPIPDVNYFDEITGEILHVKTVTSLFAFKYPNGEPCIPAELYLIDKLQCSSLGTIKNKAGHITHLIRFMFHSRLSFEGLTTRRIEQCYQRILSERKDDGTKARNRNTIITILQSWIEFLKWYASYFCLPKNYIGIGNKNRIELRLTQTTDSRGVKHTGEAFNFRINRDTTFPKPPMTQGIIKRLWTAIQLAPGNEGANISKKLKNKFTKQQLSEHFSFLSARRELILLMLESLGIRPCELIKIPRKVNLINLKEDELFIIGAKGGNDRTLKIDLGLAKKIQFYYRVHIPKLEQRLKLAGFMKENERVANATIVNSETGQPLSSSAMYCLFRNIRVEAGLEQKVCPSMFRHRFITNHVKLHLKTFVTRNPIKNRYNIIETDYLGILKKVAKLTGHRDPKSLLHYVDLAWDELDLFAGASDAKVLQDRISSIQHQIDSIQSTLYATKANKEEVLGKLLYELRELTVINKSTSLQTNEDPFNLGSTDYFE